MRTIFILAIALLMAACGSTRKTQSLTSQEAAQERITTVRTVTTREAVKTLPEVTESASVTTERLFSGVPLLIENTRHRVEVSYDSKTGTVRAEATAKAVEVPVIETTVQESIAEERDSQKDVVERRDRALNIGLNSGQTALVLLIMLLIMLVGARLLKIFR
jgi:hypothetical protein